MKEQFSAGIVVYSLDKDIPKFLLLHYEAGHWDFPKGHIEESETKKETALRELMEETGLTAEILPGFQEEFIYFFRDPATKKLIKKTVYFFAGKTHNTNVVLSHEHIGFEWLSYEKALKLLTFKNAQALLKNANSFIEDRMANSIV